MKMPTPKWEYKILQAGIKYQDTDFQNKSFVDDDLNKLGEEVWEGFGVGITSTASGNVRQIYFKRLKQ
ncbi:MAG: hypothetical protein WA139_06225 [Candidatus Aenigmatarchaeota archaeon]